jgi:raffinose/stachyose/melibiose transport system substrate-binding protein
MKKYLALILALLMALSLAACGVSNESPKNEEPAAAGGIKLYNGKIEIAEALNHAAAAYEAATGKHVEVESLGGGIDLQAQLKQYYQAGNMPDIFVFEGAPDLANWTGMVVDMSDQAWAKDTDAGFVDESGALVGFPYTTEAIGLAYNKSILEKAGVDPASITGPASMKAAFEAIEAKKGELGLTAVIGYCAEASSLYWSTGQHLFGQYLDAGLARDDTTYYDMLMDGGKLDAGRFAAFADMVALFNQYSDPALLVSGTYDQQVQGFAAGKYAFVTQGSWIGASMTSAYKADYEAAGNFECGYVPYAFIEGIDTILTNAPSHWAVYKDGNVAEAEAFLNWLATDGQQIMVQEAGCVSPFKSCNVIANDPFAGPISEYAAKGKTSAWHWMGQPSNLAQDYTGVVFQQFAMGQLDTAGFVETMTKVIPQCIK